MLRYLIAAGLILLSTGRTDVAAATNELSSAGCRAGCEMASTDQPSARDAMDNGVARIAVRATVPSAEASPLTQSDLLGLYLVLSLQGKTANSAH